MVSGCHFYDVPLLRARPSYDAVSLQELCVILANSEQSVAIVLDLVAAIAE